MNSTKGKSEQLIEWVQDVGPSVFWGFCGMCILGVLGVYVWRPIVPIVMFLLVAGLMAFHQRYYILQLMLGILAVEAILYFLFSDFLSLFVARYQGSLVALNACNFLYIAAYGFNLERVRPLFLVTLLAVVAVVGYQLITSGATP